MTAIMDFPTAWAFVRATAMSDHHEECSYRVAQGGFLCDCDVLWDEYERRGGKRPAVSQRAGDDG